MVWTNEKTLTVFIIELETYKLPRIKQHIGPPLEFEEQCTSFLLKYMKKSSIFSGPYIQNKRWIILSDRTHFDAVKLLEEELISDIQSVGIPKPITKALKRNHRILVGYEIASIYQNNDDFATLLTSFLKGKPFWLKS